jgi:hypothetical protein
VRGPRRCVGWQHCGWPSFLRPKPPTFQSESPCCESVVRLEPHRR